MSKDDNHNFINFPDEFRKARRNSLIWSCLTIAASLGQAVNDSSPQRDKISFGSLANGLVYDHAAVIIMLSIVSFYMIISFYRYDLAIKPINSHLYRKESKQDLISAVDHISTMIDNYKTAIAQNGSKILDISSDIDRRYKFLSKELKLQLNSQISELIAKLSGHPNIDAIEIANVVRSSLEDSLRIIDQIDKQVEDTYNRAHDGFIIDAKRLAENVGNLSSFSSDLNRFYDGILISEQRWYRAFDKFLTYLLFFLAIIIAALALTGHLPFGFRHQIV